MFNLQAMFITFEGLDYSGKSTQAKLLSEYLDSIKVDNILLREPGGTKISEKIREIILDKEHLEMTPLTEFMLFSASRSQLVSQIIKPYLEKGSVVICDRYYDSSTAYQSYGGSLKLDEVLQVNEIATGGLIPDMTIFIDISPEDSFARSHRRVSKDRMERKDLKFFNNVYHGFKEIATNNPARFVIVNGLLTIPQIHSRITETVNKKLNL